MPNFISIGQTIAEICWFFDFQDGSRPTSWIFKSSKFYLLTIRRVNIRHCAKFHEEPFPRYGDLLMYFKIASSVILDLLDSLKPPTKSICWSYHCAKFGWNRCTSFDNMEVLIFCVFGLKTTIHAPKIKVWGFLPLNVKCYPRDPKRH